MQALHGTAAFAVSGVRARAARASASAQPQPLRVTAAHRTRAPVAAQEARGSFALAARSSVAARLPAAPLRAARRRASAVCEARRGGDDSPNVAERLVSAIPYLLPLLDGLRYGRFFFMEYPQAAVVIMPLQPILQLYTAIPFGSLIAFFALYLGIVGNQNFSRFVRFNGQQAILLDIVLILPSLVENLFKMPSSGFGLNCYIALYNTVWLYLAISVVYAVGGCLVGKKILLPLVGEGADQQVM